MSSGTVRGYTLDMLRHIPPCRICGARAIITAAGRLEMHCIREKHFPELAATTPVTPLVARAQQLEQEEREPWWNR